MNQITGIVVNSLMAIFVAFVGIAVKSLKEYLLTRGGKKALEVVEILAKNAVNATEQVAGTLGIHGVEKLEHAKGCLMNGLESQNIYLTNEELNTFLEAAVKKANEEWKK